MPLVVDEASAEASSRLTAVRLSVATLRSMEYWRRGRIEDYDGVMILVAVVAICAERLTRDPLLEDEFKTLRTAFPLDRLTRCNISSIATATGLNRETTRRKVNELHEAGILLRAGNGTISMAPGVMQEGATLALVRRQLDLVVRLANELMRDGVVRMA